MRKKVSPKTIGERALKPPLSAEPYDSWEEPEKKKRRFGQKEKIKKKNT